MITKKWVEKRLWEHEEQLGYREIFHIFSENTMDPPTISVADKIGAICAYLGINVFKEEEKIVAKKIKKAK